MSCDIVPRVSSAAAATEFHSLSPPCDHSAETPGPLILQPGALIAGRSRYEGFKTGSCRGVCEMPRMFSASYQRYSPADAGMGVREDAETSLLGSIRQLKTRPARARKKMQQLVRAKSAMILSQYINWEDD